MFYLTRATVHFAIVAGVAAMFGIWSTRGLMGQPPTEPTPTFTADAGAEPIASWIEQLSSDVYLVRERATEALTQAGLDAEALLVEAAESIDLETRLRARRILSIVRENSIEKRIAAFESDIDGTQGVVLPGWERTRERFGDDVELRRGFAAMYRAESHLFVAYGEDVDAASVALEERLRALRDMQEPNNDVVIRYQVNDAPNPTGDNMRALLLVGSDPKISLSEASVMEIDQLLQKVLPYAQWRFEQEDPLSQSSLAEWITVRATTDRLKLQHLHLGLVYRVNATIGVARDILQNNVAGANERKFAILCIAQLGDASHATLIEPFLKDETRVVTNPRRVHNQVVTMNTEMRDFALAALVHLTEQDPTDYKIMAQAEFGPYIIQPNAIIFQDDAARDFALEKWSAQSEMNSEIDAVD